MKRFFLLVAALIVSMSAMAQDNNAASFVQVNGKAVKEFTPNEFYLWIELDERDSKGKITVEEQQRAMIALLKKQGVDIEKQLTIANVSGEFLKRRTTTASASYQLKLTTAKDVAQIGQALADLGVSRVRLQRATHSDIEAFKHEVRREAVLNARACAVELAETLGQTIGKCFYINDSNYDITPRYNNMMMRNMAYDAAPEAEVEEEPDLEFKKIKLEYSVQAKFYLN